MACHLSQLGLRTFQDFEDAMRDLVRMARPGAALAIARITG